MFAQSRRIDVIRPLVALIACATASAGCGGPATAPSAATETTETFTASARFNAVGGLNYMTTVPAITVRNAGPVTATAQFTPTAQCQFVLCICRMDGNCPSAQATCDLQSGPGAGPTLSTEGTLVSTSYHVFMARETVGLSVCGDAAPPEGLPFSFTVIVTHP